LNIYDLTIHELKEKLDSGELSASEIKEAFFDRINDVESDIKSYITLTEELADENVEKYEEKKSG